MMGGKIWFDSEYKMGSTFNFTVKVKISNKKSVSERIDEKDQLLEQAKNSLKGAKILLVEDNLVNQKVAQKILKLNDISVVIANNGKEAIELVDAEEFDGVLMDCMMPEMDGYSATEAIRKRNHLAKLPIVAMTANAMKHDIDHVLEVGMNDHIAKPINPETMLITMAKWFKKSD